MRRVRRLFASSSTFHWQSERDSHPACPEPLGERASRVALFASRVVCGMTEDSDPAGKDLSPTPRHIPHGDEIPVTVGPLECALTSRDACNLFRARSYKKCRVSPAISTVILKPTPYCNARICKPSVFCLLRTLLFYVALKSFVCHSYENCRGGGGILPVLERKLRQPQARQPQPHYRVRYLSARSASDVLLEPPDPSRRLAPSQIPGFRNIVGGFDGQVFS
jgi:hypothetical protein